MCAYIGTDIDNARVYSLYVCVYVFVYVYVHVYVYVYLYVNA